MHGGTSPGAAKGNQYAVKHGRRREAAVAERREQRRLIQTIKRLIAEAQGTRSRSDVTTGPQQNNVDGQREMLWAMARLLREQAEALG